MTIQIASSTSNFMQIQPVFPSQPHANSSSNLNYTLTSEQKNTVQQGVNDNIFEQVEKVKSSYQTAKDIDLMQSYYQQQQKLFDIYSQNSTESKSANTSAVASLTKTYSELYQLHRNVKEGRGQLPDVEVSSDDIEILPVNSNNNVSPMKEQTTNSLNQELSHKQMDTYNSLMMPSTSSYVHLSA